MTTSAFSPDGKWLLLGATTLSVYDLESKQVKVLKVPKLGAQDAMSYIAINPATSDELAIATFERSIDLSQDGGQSWKQIAKDGWGL